MPNMMDGQATPATDDKTKCPFCGKDLHDFEKKEKDQKTKVKSKPSSLGCGKPYRGGAGTWTTAAHHLICAKQCYARLVPLVRMASMAGYDINASPNGLALPTLKNKYDGERWSDDTADKGKKEKYGDLKDPQKQRVANWAMDQTKAQWHVGHHSFEQQIDWDIEEFGEDDEMPHGTSYDNQVLEELYEIFNTFKEEPLFCEEPKDSGSDIKKALDDLSKEIKEAIEQFKAGKPRKSFPYFVSQRAVKYASSHE